MATETQDVAGWHVWRSPGGIWHATRDEPLNTDEWRDAEIVRTLHADSEDEVREKAREQNKLRAKRYSRRHELDL